MNDKKISPNRAKKEKIVAELLEKAARAKGMVFTNYQGMTHKQLEGLKKKVQALNADFVSTKNTLIKIALLSSQQRDSGVPFDSAQGPQNDVILAREVPDGTSRVQNPFSVSDFKGATATLFLYGDPASPLKELAKTIKEFNLPTIKFGILDGLAFTQEQIIRISSLPSRETLLAQLAFGLKSPIANLHRALNWNIQRLILTLNAVKNTKTS